MLESKLYAYNNVGKTISEADANNKAIANYTWGPDRLLAKRDVSTNKKYFYLYNGHGDVVQIVDESGLIVNHYQYDEWGNIVEQEEEVRNDFKYAGEILDAETGLYYLRARYYDPEIGRFVSKDTYEGQISNPLSQNLFTYGHNNPLIYTDPSGHKVWLIHGTWGVNETWTPEFQKYVGALFNEPVEAIGWSGKNRNGPRAKAADDFEKVISDYQKKHPDEPIRLVGHSHGGNVAIMLANQLAEKGMKVETLITIATPVRGYKLDSKTTVGQHIHVYNKNDIIQVNGGSVWLLGSTKGRQFKGAENVRARDAEKSGIIGQKESHSSMHSAILIWNKYIKPLIKIKK